MDLFEWSQNKMKVNQNKVISDSIKNVNDELNGLTKDRMCKVYSSYVYNELWIQYLRNILRNNNVNSSIDEAFNKEINNNRINL